MQAQAVLQPQLSICTLLKSYDHDSQRMAEAWKVGFGYGIRKKNDEVDWNIYVLLHCV